MMTRLANACLVACLVISISPQRAAAADDHAPSRTLQLRAATIDTRQHVNLLGEDQTAKTLIADRHILQLDGAITPERRNDLAQAGVKLGDYLPSNAYIALVTADSREKLRKLDFVQWLGAYEQSWKLAPDIGQRLIPFQTAERLALEATGKYRLTVTLFEETDIVAAQAALEKAGADVRYADLVGPQGVLCVEVPKANVAGLTAITGVQFIEESSEVTLRNSTNRWIVQTNVSNLTPLYSFGLHGENQIIGILDGNLDRNHCSFSDTNPIGPTHRKIEAYNTSFGADSHGTHVGGTCVGDNGVNDDTRGIAFAARLVYNAVPSFSDTASYNYLETHHNQGARIHTNSWGNDGTTSYDGLSRGFDRFSYDYEESLCCLAVTNGSFLKNPENAKNLLAVGASQDTPSQDNHCSGGEGPTADGRRKPEIFAPGCSTNSSSSGTSCSTRTMTGTSMACPAVAGTALLVRQYYMEGFYPSGLPAPADAFIPSGSLVKATLLNSAVDMTGMTGYPSDEEGWGRVLIDNALYLFGDTRTMIVDQVWNDSGLSTGQVATRDFTVSGSGEQLRITLVYTEPPASAGASNPVVNNLDLEVTAPNGTTVYLGNYFSGGVSTTGGTADTKNNVEQVHVNNPPTGIWSVDVKGTAVNQGLQGYALVISGEVALGPAPPQTDDIDLELPVNTPTTITLAGFDIDEDPLDFVISEQPLHGYLSDPGAGAITIIPHTLVGGGNEVLYTPGADYAGPDAFAYHANDGGVAPDGGDSNTSSVSLLVIAPAPQITTASLPDGQVGIPYGPVQLQVTGGQPAVGWKLVTDVPYLEEDMGTNGYAPVGLAQGKSGDEKVWEYTLPFAFPFYDNTFANVRISSNGFLNFAYTPANYSNSVQGLIANARIAPLWDDLTIGVGAEDIYIDESTPGQLTIRWVAHTYNGSHPCDFCVTLFEDGTIEFHYGPGNTPITATVGVSAGDGARYTLASVNPATSLGGAHSLRFAKPAQLSPGLSVSNSGILEGTPQVAGTYLPVIRVTDGLARTDQTALPLSIGTTPGDYDGDGDVDSDDLAQFVDCLAGPDATPPTLIEMPCRDAFDADGDSDIDLTDFSALQRAFAP